MHCPCDLRRWPAYIEKNMHPEAFVTVRSLQEVNTADVPGPSLDVSTAFLDLWCLSLNPRKAHCPVSSLSSEPICLWSLVDKSHCTGLLLGDMPYATTLVPDPFHNPTHLGLTLGCRISCSKMSFRLNWIILQPSVSSLLNHLQSKESKHGTIFLKGVDETILFLIVTFHYTSTLSLSLNENLCRTYLFQSPLIIESWQNLNLFFNKWDIFPSPTEPDVWLQEGIVGRGTASLPAPAQFCLLQAESELWEAILSHCWV